MTATPYGSGHHEAVQAIKDMERLLDGRGPRTIQIDGRLTTGLEIHIRSELARSWRASATWLVFSNCCGGLVQVADRIVADVRALARDGAGPIRARATGLVASAGVLIFAACPWRTATERASFVLHRTGIDIRDLDPRLMRPETLRRLAAGLEKKEAGDANDRLVRRLRLTPEQRTIYARGDDVRLTALEAYRLDLIHQIEPSADDVARAARLKAWGGWTKPNGV